MLLREESREGKRSLVAYDGDDADEASRTVLCVHHYAPALERFRAALAKDPRALEKIVRLARESAKLRGEL